MDHREDVKSKNFYEKSSRINKKSERFREKITGKVKRCCEILLESGKI